ncbi:MAG: endonuclease III [bacterium]
MPARGPFRILVGAVLSTRTQDPVTAAAAGRLDSAAPDPASLARLKPAAVEKFIYPVGFYHTKAKALPELARMLIERWQGRVPDTMAELLELPGVGRKVANIVLAGAFGRPAIAVDVHVQRISNRLGLVRTTRPEQTEQALERILPRNVAGRWNALIVALGQTICRPQRPRCGQCPVRRWCRRVGVARTANDE